MNAVTVMFAVFICLSISQTFSISPCKQGFYYNSRARKCDDCANVCYHPADQYQLDECNTYCPDYLRKSTATDSAETTCPQGYYFDPHVGIRGKCEPCSVLCHRHVITRNTKDCKTKCAGFLEQGVGKTSKTRTDCPKGFYFDPHVGVKGKCEPCSVLCYAHKVTRNTEDCKSKCPDEYASKEAGANQTGDPVNATEQAGASGSSGEDSKKGKESRQLGKAGVASGDKTEGNNNVLIIAIACVVGVIGVICIVGRLVFFVFKFKTVKLKKIWNGRKEPVKDEENNAQTGKLLGGPPVQECMTKRETTETTELAQSDDTQVKMAHGEVCESYKYSYPRSSQS